MNIDFRVNIGVKLAAGFIFANLLIMALCVGPYLSIDRLVDRAERIDVAAHERIFVASVVSDLDEAASNADGYLLGGEKSFLENYNVSIDRLNTHLREGASAFRNQESRQQYGKMTELISQRVARLQGDVDARRRVTGKICPDFQLRKSDILLDAGIRKLANEIEQVSQKTAEEQIASHRQLASGTKTAIIVACLICSVLFTAVSLGLTRHIAKPLRDITRTAERISEGDLTVAVNKYTREDEVGMLAKAFERMTVYLEEMSIVAGNIATNNLTVRVYPRSDRDLLGNAFLTMLENLRRMISDLNDAADVMASSSNEILALTTQLAASSSETATAVSQTSTTISEVKQTVRLVSQKADYVSDSAQNAAAVSQNGRAAVNESVIRMNQIREQMESIADSIVKLSEQSQTIGAIIASVNDIANQSNLLAVNASIEAAKAGEQGKGFAVVAQEVRNLAEQSKEATSQIRAILNDIQKAITGAVMATEQGSKAVDAGVMQSHQAGESIKTMSEAVSESALATTQIVASTNEQVVGIDQVALAMDNIKRASEQIAASIRYAESSSMNLHELGNRLKQVIGRFKIQGD
ncbi:MAG TPA: methyl-accepting chemotaxis protein [Candidatus Deferrimicrobiaceae bacterium]